MAVEGTKPAWRRRTSNPDRPAYDNPVGNKGGLAVGNNVKKPPQPAPCSKPQGHDSDKVLGKKPPPG